jgi:hypothetical protein
MVVQYAMLHKGAATRFDANQALQLQGGDGLAQGMPIDTKARRKLYLAWHAASVGISPVLDLGFQGVSDLAPDRDAAPATRQ